MVMRLFAKLPDRAEHIELDFVEMRTANNAMGGPAVNTFVVRGTPSQTFMEHAYESGAAITFGVLHERGGRIVFEGFVSALEQDGDLILADVVTMSLPTFIGDHA